MSKSLANPMARLTDSDPWLSTARRRSAWAEQESLLEDMATRAAVGLGSNRTRDYGWAATPLVYNGAGDRN